MVIGCAGGQAHLRLDVLTIDDTGDCKACHIDRHQPKHRPHRLGFFGPALTAAVRAPGPRLILPADQVRNATRDRWMIIGKARHLQRVDRLSRRKCIACRLATGHTWMT